MERGRGSTVEEPFASLQAKKWKDQIIQKLEIEAPIHEDKSFLNNEDLKMEAQKMFAGSPTLNGDPIVKKRGRPKVEDFTKVDAEDNKGE
jgi:hypothetical protein